MVDLCGNSITGIEKVEICAMAETEPASRPQAFWIDFASVSG
jgi:hypothetical protein